MVEGLRKEIWRLSRAHLDPDDIRDQLKNEIIIPELTTGESADIAQATFKRLLKLRAKKLAASDADEDERASASPQPEDPALPAKSLATSREAPAVLSKPE